MISISDTAQAHFAQLLADQSQQTTIRVFVVNPGTAQAECGVSDGAEDAVEESDIRRKLP
ncbi:Fe-S biogenesis protein NfuA, partial [Pseudoalteromonas sp. SIMBA_153]